MTTFMHNPIGITYTSPIQVLYFLPFLRPFFGFPEIVFSGDDLEVAPRLFDILSGLKPKFIREHALEIGDKEVAIGKPELVCCPIGQAFAVEDPDVLEEERVGIGKAISDLLFCVMDVHPILHRAVVIKRGVPKKEIKWDIKIEAHRLDLGKGGLELQVLPSYISARRDVAHHRHVLLGIPPHLPRLNESAPFFRFHSFAPVETIINPLKNFAKKNIHLVSSSMKFDCHLMLDCYCHKVHTFCGGSYHFMEERRNNDNGDLAKLAAEKTLEGNSAERMAPAVSGGSLQGVGEDLGEGQGVSNTPITTYKGPSIDVCIDYIKVTLLFPYKDQSGDYQENWDDIFDALYLHEEDGIRLARGGSNFDNGWRFDEDLFLFSGGNLTRSASGLETSLIEMKGEACRRFEERAIWENYANTGILDRSDGFIHRAWFNFFSLIAKLPHRVTRFDVPVDDISGLIPLSEIKAKVIEGALTSPLRKREHTQELIDGEIIGRGIVREQGLGWSYSLGGRSTQQLVIYDKKAEMEKKYGKGSVLLPSWVRYESRFYHDTSDVLFPELVKAMSSDEVLAFQRFAIGCLSKLITFRDKKMDGNNTYKAAIWDKWEEFIAMGEEPQYARLKKPILTIKANAEWIKKEVDRTFFRLVAAYPESLVSIVRYVLNDGSGKMNGDDLSIINSSRKSRGLEPYESEKDAQKAVYQAARLDYGSSKEILALFDEKRKTELEIKSDGIGGE